MEGIKAVDVKTREERTVYIDHLRVFATFAIVVLHVAAIKMPKCDVNGFEWQTFNFYDSIVRWGVSAFVMISGALFLGRDIPVKKIYSKYVLRMLCAFIAWSFFYAAVDGGGIKHILFQTLKGQDHLWFVFMIAGLYICMPVLKLIVDKGWRTRYYLALAFVFGFLIPEIIVLINCFGGETAIKLAGAVNEDIGKMDMRLVLGFSSIFILGYCLHKIKLSKQQRALIYILGLAGFIFTIVMDSVTSVRAGQSAAYFYDNFTVNVLFESMAVYTAFRYARFNNKRLNHVMKTLAKYSFGVYLVHIFILYRLEDVFGLSTLSFNPVISVPVISIIVFFTSYCISAILNHLPVVSKYIV